MGMAFGGALPSRQEFKDRWLSFLIWGFVLITLGALAITLAQFTTYLSVLTLGVLFLLAGIVVIFDAFYGWWGKSQGFFLHIVTGILYLILGFMLLAKPMVAAISLTLLMAIFFIIIGILRLILSPIMRFPRWGWSFLSGIITLVLGILILFELPLSGIYIIGLFVGIDLLVWGFTYLSMALYSRSG